MRKLESKPLTEELIEGHWCLLERECDAKMCFEISKLIRC